MHTSTLAQVGQRRKIYFPGGAASIRACGKQVAVVIDFARLFNRCLDFGEGIKFGSCIFTRALSCTRTSIHIYRASKSPITLHVPSMYDLCGAVPV